jgi:hypothetical protein
MLTDPQEVPTMKSTRIAAIAVISSLAGGLIATAAGATFNDVAENGRFAESITNVQEAGIAGGFPDGTFRPTNALNRQQAASWIDRAASRAALDFADQSGEYAPVNPGDPIRELAEIEMSSPALATGGGWVSLDGYVAAATDDATGAGCPCAFDVRVLDSSDDVVAYGLMTTPGAAEDDERADAGPVGIAPVQGVVWLPGGTAETYRLVLELHDSDVGDVLVAGTLSGSYAPMAEGDPVQLGDLGSGAVSLDPTH